jgi:hypothetical protein
MNRKTHQELSDDPAEYPRSVKFRARRAILNAIKKAKITDGTYKPNSFICKFPRNKALKNLLDTDFLRTKAVVKN